jgi:UDP-N-acetylmuramoyl-tripeptide--D-alanyl-D-alanine ligase
MMDAQAAALAVDGRLVGAPVVFSRVTTDSRSLLPGDLFVALAGERFDGHDFVAQAQRSGAVAALVAANRASTLPGNLIVVADPLRALGTLAKQWRARFALPLAAVVGSNGKTTTKEMIASIFREAAGEEATLSTSGNFNNAIGLPLTLLRLRAEHRLAVVEIGMNHRGETRELVALAQPTIVVVTNAQREHQEFMESVAQVAHEHADAVRGLAPGGFAVLNSDDPSRDVWRAAARIAGASVVEFAQRAHADVTGSASAREHGSAIAIATPEGSIDVELAVPGAHMVANALAAAAVARAAGVPLDKIAAGLARFRPLAGRLTTRMSMSGARVIDDTYNANPDSVRAAIDVLAAAGGERWLVLGDMGEVGAKAADFHREVGDYARESGVTRLLAAGEHARDAVNAFGQQGEHFDSVEALAAHVATAARDGVTILVKGSRFMRMERVVATLCGETSVGVH